MVPAGSDRIPRVPPYSGLRPDHTLYVYGTFTLFGRIFQTIPLSVLLISTTLQPRRCLNSIGLGYSHFARHYSGNHYCFLFLRVLRCFSSPGSLPVYTGYPPFDGWVPPFGHPRIKGYLHLPAASRSLSRPSSPLRAKASPVRS